MGHENADWAQLRALAVVFHFDQRERLFDGDELLLMTRGNTRSLGGDWAARGRSQLGNQVFATGVSASVILNAAARFLALLDPELRGQRAPRLLDEVSSL